MAKIDKLLKQAEEYFDDGECALQTVFGAYETKRMGRDSVRNGIFIATDQRLLFYAKKLTGYDFEAFPYTNISSMEMGKSLMGHYINFFASGNSAKMKWISTGDVRAFVDTVKAQMASAKSTKASSSEQPMDPVARSEAHDSGLCAANAETRQRFSRDLLNMTLASPQVNRHSKSDKDAAAWMPELNECWFAFRIVQVRRKYGLTIDRREADTLEGVLSACKSTEMIVQPCGQ